jgi:hypothetical protein
MPRPRNPDAELHTVKIPKYLVADLTARAAELRKSMAAYIVDLIEADRVNRQLPQIVYPTGYQGPPLSFIENDQIPKRKKQVRP